MTPSNDGRELVLRPSVPVRRMARQTRADQDGQSATGGDSLPVDWERLSRIYIHHLRISILEVLGIDGGRVLSPTDLSQELRHDLSNTDYHVRQMAKAGLIALAYRRQGQRGANENFYRLS